MAKSKEYQAAYAAKREASSSNKIGKIETSNLPPLTGVSERQIKYGEDMRERYIGAYNYYARMFYETDKSGLSDIQLENRRVRNEGLKSSMKDDSMFEKDGKLLRDKVEEWKAARREKGIKTTKQERREYEEKLYKKALKEKYKEVQRNIKEHKDAKWWIERKR